MNVLVIPENAKYDRHMLQPIMERMITSWLGIPANVSVMDQMKLGSRSQATARETLRRVINQYRMVDLFILCIDQDDRSDKAADQTAGIENDMREHLNERGRPADAFFTVVAEREIEAWVLAGCEESGPWTYYTEVRQEPQAKERCFEPYAEQRGVDEKEFGGRGPLGEGAARNYSPHQTGCQSPKTKPGIAASCWESDQFQTDK